MKTIVLVALLLACSMASTLRPMSKGQISKFENLKKGNKWASIMMNLAELHTQAEGPLDDLVEAIEEVVADLERKTDKAHDNYDQQTAEHEAEVTRINGQINSANADIAHTTEFIENVLLVQEASLEQEIANLQTSIANTQQYIVDQTSLRASQRQKFNEIIIEHEEALAAVEEAKEVLSQLGDGTSLLQVKRAKKSLEKVQQKVKKNIHSSMIKALLELSAGEFADREAVQKVHDLLSEVANNLNNSIVKYNAEEQQAQASFEADVANKESEINRMSIELTEKSEQLEQTKQSIEDNREFLEQRKRDLSGYEQDLEDENANFDHITELYEDLVEQLTAESRACAEALDVLKNADIAGYIGGRMEQDVIIDQPHGTGITVESNPFDLE